MKPKLGTFDVFLGSAASVVGGDGRAQVEARGVKIKWTSVYWVTSSPSLPLKEKWFGARRRPMPIVLGAEVNVRFTGDAPGLWPPPLPPRPMRAPSSRDVS